MFVLRNKLLRCGVLVGIIAPAAAADEYFCADFIILLQN
jgi:hypothetical protein